MIILETERLLLRELDAVTDAEFILELLNTPGFLKYIGDRGVRSLKESRSFIEDRYRKSYREHGYGLYTVDLKHDNISIGLCGFVRRDNLPAPDIGFAFLPQFEGQGFGFESANAVMKYGREVLGFEKVLAITSLDNHVSGRLLAKLGFTETSFVETPEGEKLRLFAIEVPNQI